MIDEVRQYSQGYPVNRPYTVKEMFDYSVRYQVLVDTQEQKDFLTGMQLMYGREIQVDTWDMWEQKRRLQDMAAHYDHSKMKLRLLPIVFTTSKRNLRGL